MPWELKLWILKFLKKLYQSADISETENVFYSNVFSGNFCKYRLFYVKKYTCKIRPNIKCLTTLSILRHRPYYYDNFQKSQLFGRILISFVLYGCCN